MEKGCRGGDNNGEGRVRWGVSDEEGVQRRGEEGKIC